MEDNRYKSCFFVVIIIAVIVLAILALPLMLSSCHTHKDVSQAVSRQHAVQTVADSTTETAERTQWLSELRLDLDSFEMVILPYPDVPGTADSCLVLERSSSQPHRQAGAVVLRAKHAALGKADYVERDLSGRTQQHTASSDTSSLVAQEKKTVDMTAVAKPPNMDLAITMITLILLAFAAMGLRLWLYLKRNR